MERAADLVRGRKKKRWGPPVRLLFVVIAALLLVFASRADGPDPGGIHGPAKVLAAAPWWPVSQRLPPAGVELCGMHPAGCSLILEAPPATTREGRAGPSAGPPGSPAFSGLMAGHDPPPPRRHL